MSKAPIATPARRAEKITRRARHPSAAEIAARVLLASCGGYLLTYSATAALARVLAVAPASAVLISTNLSFALYVAVVIWVFADSNIKRIVLAMAALALCCLAIGFGGSV